MPTLKKYWTRNELVRKIQLENDLESEDFIQPEEMYGLITEAISEVEKIVHTLYEDYFLSRHDIELINGEEGYDLPPDIFAHKIRGVFLSHGSEVPTEIQRCRDYRKIGSYTGNRHYNQGTGRAFEYFILNSSPGEPKITLTPPPLREGTLTVWYLRHANRLEEGTDVLDIPESVGFICQYVKTRAYEKEGHPLLQKAVSDLVVFKEQFEGVLRDMIPDNDTSIEMDMSIYGEMN